MDGAEEVADRDPGDADAEGGGHAFDPLPPTLPEDACGGAPAVEDGNDGDEGDVENKLHDKAGLEESEARPDGAVGGVGVKEGGGALSGEGDENAEEAANDAREMPGVEGNKRSMGG